MPGKTKTHKQNAMCKSGCNIYSIGLSDENWISLTTPANYIDQEINLN